MQYYEECRITSLKVIAVYLMQGLLRMDTKEHGMNTSKKFLLKIGHSYLHPLVWGGYSPSLQKTAPMASRSWRLEVLAELSALEARPLFAKQRAISF